MALSGVILRLSDDISSTSQILMQPIYYFNILCRVFTANIKINVLHVTQIR
jgi:hypothetical protein